MFENDSDIDPSKIAIVSGVSKGYAMTGFRVGWTRTSPFVAAQMTKIQEPLVSCATAFSQTAAAAALNGPQQCVGDMLSQYKKRRDLAMSILKARGRPSAYTPGGAFYLPVDVSTSGMSSRDFALKLLSDKHCAVAPGIAFNTSEGPPSGDNLAILDSFVRVSLANSDENVGKGMHLLCDMLDELEAKA
ncbi:aminotransferase class I and II [Ochromonadaceae sp. CCMP2298]|nr:aminotransferase class I and II [Ochromonadaceae sp. CCMP2298]